jgi:hypothetical protein
MKQLRKICTRHSWAVLSQVKTEEDRLYGWFQQGSATVHTARIPVQALSDVFWDKIVSSDIWPSTSPDLNPCDFFVWGCLKDKVYNSSPQTEELKENIRREIANIPAEQLQMESRICSAGARNVCV